LLFATDRHGKQLARPRDVGGAAATGQQSVVPDAVETAGQHVHQEASDGRAITGSSPFCHSS
jgi:hypothetical protein